MSAYRSGTPRRLRDWLLTRHAGLAPRRRRGAGATGCGAISAPTRWRWPGWSSAVVLILAVARRAAAGHAGSRARRTWRTGWPRRSARALVRHRRTRPRRLFAPALRRAHHARHGGRDRAAGGADRPRRRLRRRLLRRHRRSRADARDRRVPGLPAPDPGAGLRRRAQARHHQRHHRHRADRLAALCAAGAGRDADHPQHRLHRRRAADRRLAPGASCCATSCRSASAA